MPLTIPDLPCTWAQFVAWVTASLDVDADRLNYEDKLLTDIRYALLEIQQKVPRYRQNHESVYTPGDFVTQGAVSIGALPLGSIVPKGLTVVRTKAAEVDGEDDDCHSYPASVVPFSEVSLMVANDIAVNNGRPLWAWSRKEGNFYVAPKIQEEDEAGYAHKAILKFDGVRMSYGDNDTVPFDEMVKETVVEYVKANIAINVEKNAGLHNARLREYFRKQRLLMTQ